MTLQHEPRRTITLNGVDYDFFPYYNRVLTLLSEVFASRTLTDFQKIQITVTSVSTMPPCKDAFELIVNELFPPQKKIGGDDDPKTMDFEQDAGLIYAGFLQTYGIDLYKERNKMDWRVFIALVRGLPSNTEFSRVVKLRCTKIPKLDKHNAEYVESLMKAKRAVELEEPAEVKRKRMAQKWLQIAEGLLNVRR